MNKLILFITFNLLFANTYCQLTRIRGTVSDTTSGEPIPFVNVAFKGSTIGTTTSFDGKFFLETRYPSDSLTASYMGYKTQSIAIKKGAYQEVFFKLQSNNIEIEEVVIKPGENPAHRILRNIVKNKKNNNPERLSGYKYKVYNKMEMDINNITKELKQRKAFKHFQFIFDYVDTSAVTGQTFLPVFIVESISNFYYQKQPNKKKEEIIANKISGVENNMISDFTGQMYLDFNIYKNTIAIMQHDLISPISRIGLMYYKYYLTDSTFRQNSWCYNISFKPRRKQEPTFSGNFWVNDSTWAIESYKMQIAEDMNINFVKHFVAEQKYKKINDSIWFPKKQSLFIDFVISNKDYGFFGRKTTNYSEIEVNPKYPNNFFNKQLSQETITLNENKKLSAKQWDTIRPEMLSERESDIYKMVDSIKEVPLYKNIVTLINTFITGYWKINKIEIGPYFTLFSFNPIEGARFKFGFRTSHEFSKKIRLGGHIAYGTRDRKFKFGSSVNYVFNKNPRRTAGINYKYDYEQLGLSNRAFLSDNILSSIFARRQNDKLTKVSQGNLFYEHEWIQGISNTITFSKKMIFPSKTVPFLYINSDMDTVKYNRLSTTEIKLNTRIAYNEKFVIGEFNRLSLGTKYPILNINLTVGLQGILEGKYKYHKIDINIKDKIRVTPLGVLKVNVVAGKVFGNIPYPFLQLHEGNQTYAFDDYAFNLMNYYEFVSDQYASLMLENHFKGAFLNHIPLFRKLKWREVAHFKVLIGDLTRRQTDYVAYPKNLKKLRKPYMETGVGIENIFKFFRVDAIWRLSYLNHKDIIPFGVFVKMQVRF